MSRPHEDLQHHQAVNHVAGGVPVAYAPGAWCAIAIGHVNAERSQAAVSSYETLVEKAQRPPVNARGAAVFRSADGRRVVAIIRVDGHEQFRHLQTLWSEHHRVPDHPPADRRPTLELYQLIASAGKFVIDTTASGAHAIERIADGQDRTRLIIDPITAANGFRSLGIFATDQRTDCVIIYHFAHDAELGAARASAAVSDIFGDPGEDGNTMFYVRPLKTF
jgi:hypothetical protein